MYDHEGHHKRTRVLLTVNKNLKKKPRLVYSNVGPQIRHKEIEHTYGHRATGMQTYIFKTYHGKHNEKINSKGCKMHVSSLCHFRAEVKSPVVFKLNFMPLCCKLRQNSLVLHSSSCSLFRYTVISPPYTSISSNLIG